MKFRELYSLLKESNHLNRRVYVFLLGTEEKDDILRSMFGIRYHPKGVEGLLLTDGKKICEGVYFIGESTMFMDFGSEDIQKLFECMISKYGFNLVSTAVHATPFAEKYIFVAALNQYIQKNQKEDLKNQGFENTDDLDAL